MDERRTPAEYELEDCGIDHTQYFTGRGTAYTNWEQVFIGAGETPHDAAEDALESAAQSGWNTNSITNDLSEDGISLSVLTADAEESELYYYVVLYLR